jgi:hypothetical protein
VVLMLLKQDEVWAESGAGETFGRCRADAGFWMRSSTRFSSVKRSSDAILSGRTGGSSRCGSTAGPSSDPSDVRKWLDDNRARLLDALG